MPKSTLFTQLNTLAELTAEYRTKELQRIAKAKDTPAKTLLLLADHDDWGVLREVYINNNTPESVINTAIIEFKKTPEDDDSRWTSGYLLRDSARNRNNLSRKTQEFFASEETFQSAFAENPAADYDLLVKLTDCKLDIVKWLSHSLASNKSVKKDILLKLYATKDILIWSAIARNNKMPAEILSEMYANSPEDTDDTFVRSNIAGNTGSTPELLTSIAKDNPNSELNYSIAANPSISPELLKYYQMEGNAGEKRAAVRNRKTTVDDLTAMANTGSAESIAEAVGSKKFSPVVLKELFEKYLKQNDAEGFDIYWALRYSEAYANARIVDPNFPTYMEQHPYVPPVSQHTNEAFDSLLQTMAQYMKKDSSEDDFGHGRN